MMVMNSGSQLSEMTTISHVFVVVFSECLYLCWSCHVSLSLSKSLIKCPKGHKSQGAAFEGVLKMSLSLSFLLDHSHHSDQMFQWSQVSKIALCMAKVNVIQ